MSKKEKGDVVREAVVIREQKGEIKKTTGQKAVQEIVRYVPVSDFQKVFETKPVEEVRGLADEFKEFVNEFNFISLAIGFIIGGASKDVVNSLVKDVISPLLGIFIPQGSLEEIVWIFFGAEVKIGAFVNELISFLIIAGIIFIVAVKLMKIKVKK